MLVRYSQLKLHPNVLHSLTGLRPVEFEQLIQDVRPLFVAAENKRHIRADRMRAIGAGHPFTLPMQEQILLTLIWLRVYPTYEVLGFLFGITHSTVSRLLTRVLPILAQAGRDTMRMPDPGRKHRRNFDQLLSDLPEFAVVIDSFEQRIQRPQIRDGATPSERKVKGKEADKWYSGKKRGHTIKSQVGVDLHSGLICDVSGSVRGPTADIRLLRALGASGLMKRLPQGVGGEGDLAYVGIDKLHPSGLGYTPRRKPRGADKHRPRGQDRERPAEDIEYNKAFAQRRVVVEHTLCRVRCYQSLTQTDRNHSHRKERIQQHTYRVQAICGLINRKMQSRLPYLFI
jgi:hypothetical protein